MPHPSPRPVLLLVVVVAAALALLVGLVSSGRGSTRSRASRPNEAWSPAEPVSVRVPIVPEPVEDAPVVADELATSAVADSHAGTNSPVEPVRTNPLPDPSRREPARIRGLVLRPEGDPASEARIVLGEQHARCTPDGRFELALADDAGPADLIAFEPGYEPVLRPTAGADVGAGSTQELRLVLGPSTLSLTGTVTTRTGQPLEGWTVELDGLDPLTAYGLREPVRTDAAGRFVLPDVPSGIHVVRAFATRRELAFRAPPIAAGEEGLVVLAEPEE